MSPLVEREDFYYNEDGYMVFTEKYHLERGYCCGNGCRHCPYDRSNCSEREAFERDDLSNLSVREKNNKNDPGKSSE